MIIQHPMNQVPIPQNCFDYRYILRHPILDDVPDLLRLENACRPPELRNSEKELRSRIENLPRNHVLLIVDAHIVGAVYTQRIKDIDDLENHTCHSVSELHIDTGPIVHILSMDILSSMFCLGYGNQLLEFMLLNCSLNAEIEKVSTVVQCRGNHPHEKTSFHAYIRQQDKNEALADPMLGFHAGHGGEIKKIIPHYYPGVRENNEHGVLVEYDIKRRKPSEMSTIPPLTESPIETPSDLAETITDAVKFILKTNNRHEQFNPGTAFSDMGIKGLELFGLRILLAGRLNRTISPTLFYRHSSTTAVINHFSRRLFPGIHNKTNVDGNSTEPVFHKCNVLKTNVSDDDIAVVGMACRFPGADDITEFWDLLCHGRDAITETPPRRWDKRFFRGESRHDAGKIASSSGGYLKNVGEFDARFFGISPREARQMDPQHRLLLELNRDALESAGIDPETLKGINTGIFAGVFTNDYQFLQLRQNDWPDYDIYFNTGSSPAMAAGRIAYALGCSGPAISVNTACSSSLVAIHMACQSLLQGECDMALGSGVNLLLSPEVSISFSRAGLLSPDGRCKTFDASANGYVRSEGAGVVVLKRLKDALRDRHTIHGIIKGSAVNQDGASNGLTAPNGLAQVRLIKEALSRASLSPDDISYIEAHGTGTSLGDPIEYDSLLKVFGQTRPGKSPLVIGSVKTNIGHTEGAAGVAGLIKVLLAMKHRFIPRHLHFTKVNPMIDLNALPAVIPGDGMKWPASKKALAAGISSFGFSGTNAHVIVREFNPSQRTHTDRDTGNTVLSLSAKDEIDLAEMTREYADFLALHPELDVNDICYTAHVGRTHFNHRIAVFGSSTHSLGAQLKSACTNQNTRGIHTGCSSRGKIAFLFTGQGSQYLNMARKLYADEPCFQVPLDRCAAILRKYLGTPLRDLIFQDNNTSKPDASNQDTSNRDNAPSNKLNQTLNTQPVLFSLEYALAKLWESRGITPDIMMGHSVGEYVAACLAGVFSLEDALRLISCRAKLMDALPSGGGMAAVFESAETVKAECRIFSGRLDIAAYNGPNNIVVSGRTADVTRFTDTLDRKDIKTVPLNVSHAFHSFLMEPMLAEFKNIAERIRFTPPRKDIVSNVSGSIADESMASPDYWVSHIRQPVSFAQSIACLLRENTDIFLEIGPKPVLINMARQCLPQGTHKPPVLAASLTPGVPDNEAMGHALAALYAGGADIDWNAFHKKDKAQRISLPTYPYRRKRFWLKSENRTSMDLTATEKTHPLLGSMLETPLEDKIFSAEIGSEATAYLKDHRSGKQASMPGAGFLEIALAAARELWKGKDLRIAYLVIETPLIIPDNATCRIQTVISPLKDAHLLSVYLKKDNAAEKDAEWIRHCSMQLIPQASPSLPFGINAAVDTDALKQFFNRETGAPPPATGRNRSPEKSGSCFNGPVNFAKKNTTAIGRISLPPKLQQSGTDNTYIFHPALMDACFQTAARALTHSDLKDGETLLLMGIDSFEMVAPPADNLWCKVETPGNNGLPMEILTADLMVYNPDGKIIASAGGLNFRKTLLTDTGIPGTTANTYQKTWHPASQNPFGTPSNLPEPKAVKEGLNPALFPDSGDIHHLRYLTDLSRHYVKEAFIQLGWQPESDIGLSPQEIIVRLNIAPRHHRLMERLLKIMAPDEQVTLPKDTHPSNSIKTLFKGEGHPSVEPPEIKTELSVLKAFGSNLARVLRGECDPLDLLFPEADISNAVALYETSLAFGAINGIVARVIEQIIDKVPLEKEIRILEIGAGTGGTTAHILPVLKKHRVRYAFTDVSLAFARKAKERFSQYPFMEYRPLDIEKEPLSQGYEANAFDIIVGANVFHATADLSVTLKHARQLLSPEGILVLVEGTACREWIDLIFGVIEGWWRFKDHHYRQDYPLMPETRWKTVLKENGFHGPVSITPIPPEEALFPQSVIMAKNNREAFETKPEESHRHWLLIGNNGPMEKMLAHTVMQNGDAVTHVHPGETHIQWCEKDACLTLNMKEPEQFKLLLESAPETTHIVYLCGMNAEILEGTTVVELAGHMQHTCAGLLYLVQALGECMPLNFQSLCIITAGAHPVHPDFPVQPAMAPLWGIADVIQKEHPEFHCRIVDTEPLTGNMTVPGGKNIHCLLSLLTDRKAPPDTAIRKGRIFIPRLKKIRLPIQQLPHSDTEGSVLITGGLGGTGLTLGRHLAENDFRHLVLMSRRPPDARTREHLEELRAKGASVKIMTGDVADYGMLAAVFNRIKTELPPLKGIIHTAGVFEDSLLGGHKWTHFERVFAAKVQGSWNLHLLSRRYKLDFFVFFSSAMTLLPNPGLSNYVAANAFMDAMAHYRQALDLPAISIAWGPWDDVGMAAAVGKKRREQWSAWGLTPLSTDDALNTLDSLMYRQDTRSIAGAAVMDIDWKTFAGYHSDRVSHFYGDLIPVAKNDTAVNLNRTSSEKDLADILKKTPLQERTHALNNWVQKRAATIMGFDTPHQLNMQEGFFQQGMDSLTAMELRSQLQGELKVTIPATEIFKHPTVVGLGNYIRQNFLKHLFSSPTKTDAFTDESETKELSEEVKNLSQKHLNDSLETELNELERMLDL